MKETTDFINAETGEVLFSIDTFLDTLESHYDREMAVCLLDNNINFYEYPFIVVVSTRDYESGSTLQIRTTLENLLCDRYDNDSEDD